MEDSGDVFGGEFGKGEDSAAGKESGLDFEAWVFGGGADESDDACFNWTQEHVLLRFGEAVDLITEDDGLSPRQSQLAPGLPEYFLALGHACAGRIDLHESGAR